MLRDWKECISWAVTITSTVLTVKAFFYYESLRQLWQWRVKNAVTQQQEWRLFLASKTNPFLIFLRIKQKIRSCSVKTTSDEDRSCQFGKTSAHTFCKGDQSERKHFYPLFNQLQLEKKKSVVFFFYCPVKWWEKMALFSLYHCSCLYWPCDFPYLSLPPLMLITLCNNHKLRRFTCVTECCVTVKAVLLHVKMDLKSLTLGLLRGLEESPVDAPLTERDLTNRTGVKKILSRGLLVYPTWMSLVCNVWSITPDMFYSIFCLQKCVICTSGCVRQYPRPCALE